MADYYVREEDGTSRYVLEDGSGDLILETVGAVERSAAINAVADIATIGVGPFSPTRISQLAVEVLVRGAPLGRLSQLAVEVVTFVSHETVNIQLVALEEFVE